MNALIADVVGVITGPAAAIARAMEAKRWKAVLALILLVTAAVTFATFPVTKADQARMVRDSEMADKLSDEQLASLENFTPFQRVMGAVTAMFFAVLALVLSAFFVYLFYKIGGGEGLYANYFAAVTQASILDMVLGGVLKGVLVLLKRSMLVQTGLTLFFPGLDFRSLPFIVLSQFDFFSLWFLAALALGIAAYSKMAPRKSFGIAALYFLFKSLILVALSFFSMKMMGM
ncbi:MAG TPA: YIP1 family protein [Candidatus Aminicenantes bacterium]|nr:YIP1 family protein [Candidatus Aminicenantes bacterium]